MYTFDHEQIWETFAEIIQFLTVLYHANCNARTQKNYYLVYYVANVQSLVSTPL